MTPRKFALALVLSLGPSAVCVHSRWCKGRGLRADGGWRGSFADRSNARRRLPLCGILLALLLVFGPGASYAQDTNAARLFNQRCGARDSLQPGVNRAGPSLFGVMGRAAGSVRGARYSQALKASQIVWDAQTLDAFLANPRGVAPKTTMRFRPRNTAQRAALIGFLSSVR